MSLLLGTHWIKVKPTHRDPVVILFRGNKTKQNKKQNKKQKTKTKTNKKQTNKQTTLTNKMWHSCILLKIYILPGVKKLSPVWGPPLERVRLL